MIPNIRLTLFAILASSLPAAQFPLAIGLVTQAGSDTKIQRADMQSTLPTFAGDLLFPGDSLLANGAGVVISFCPDGKSYSLDSGQMTIEAKRVVLHGENARSAVQNTPCELPSITYRTYRDVRTGADTLQLTDPEPHLPENDPSQPRTPVLSQLDLILKSRPQDLTALTSRAIEWERAGNLPAAARDYKTIHEIAPNAFWAADQMRATLAQAQRAAAGQGKTIGVVVGISQYANLSASEYLYYADRDADYFYDFLISPRGKARPLDVALLVNEQATISTIRLAIKSAFARAKPHDQVVLYFAAHGIPVDKNENSGAYIMAYDSDKEDPSTMFAMTDLQEVTDDKLRPRSLQVFADTCHAGYIGETETRRENLFLTDFLTKRRAETEVLGLLASEKQESSYECSNLDQGHGAFTYYLLRGLNSDEAVDRARHQVTVYSLFEYVRRNVVEATDEQPTHQTPVKKAANVNDSEMLASLDLLGNAMPGNGQTLSTCDKARGLPQKHLPSSRSDGGLLDPNTREVAAQLNAGQQVLVRYLKGEQTPMTREDFAQCETSFANASRLQGGRDPLTEARLLFCTGRRMIFDKRLDEAAAILEQAIRRDPLSAYAYNALGIALLEKPDFRRAIAAFDDAVRLAPDWAYARHNLALALEQDGQYTPAIVAYRDAFNLGRQYAYIPFNLGLLYERLNQPQEARAAWRQALDASPEMARAWTAIGLSYSLEGRSKDAESAYRTGLTKSHDQTDRLAARHDLALLLANEKRLSDALVLWRQNLEEDPEDLPSLIGLSDALYKSGELAGARPVFARLLTKKREFVGARLQYAHLLIDSGGKQEAAEQLRILLSMAPDNAEACEMLADLLTGDDRAAMQLYNQALKNATSRKQKLRIEQKKRERARH